MNRRANPDPRPPDANTPDPGAPDRDPGEQPLRALFDATAPPADPLALQRLARHAATLPEAGARRRWRRLRWPALGLAAAAALSGLVWWRQHVPAAGPTAGHGPVASALLTASAARVADAIEQWQPDDDEAQALAGVSAALLGDDEPFPGGDPAEAGAAPAQADALASFGWLGLPEDPAALDALDQALDTLLEDG